MQVARMTLSLHSRFSAALGPLLLRIVALQKAVVPTRTSTTIQSLKPPILPASMVLRTCLGLTHHANSLGPLQSCPPFCLLLPLVMMDQFLNLEH